MSSKNPLRILHLEDDKIDFMRVHKMLESSNIKCDIIHVQTREEFAQHLDQEDFDLILSDLNVPAFDGAEALELTRKIYSDLPFIFVSGTMGEEAAVEALKAGATDYVLKTNLEKLPHSVTRAM